MHAHRQHHKTVSAPEIWTPINLLGVALIALLLGAACNLDPEPMADHSAEWSLSQELKELQASEAGSAAREVAAQKLCDKAHGPNSAARWLPDGSLACTTRRAVVKAQVQL